MANNSSAIEQFNRLTPSHRQQVIDFMAFLQSRESSAQLKAWSERDYLADRAQKGSWEDFQAILAQVPDREPEPFDRL